MNINMSEQHWDYGLHDRKFKEELERRIRKLKRKEEKIQNKKLGKFR
jgi:hypothetical protein